MSVLCLGAMLSCQSGHGDHDEHEHEGEAHGASDEIVMSEEKASAAGVSSEIIGKGEFHSVIIAGGKLTAASGHETTLSANVSGIVSFVRPVAEGSVIGKGVTLFTISSSNLQDGDPFEHAKIAYENAKSEYERASSLVGEQIISRKEFNAAKAAYESAKVSYEAVASSRGSRGSSVASPSAGTLTACYVSEGDYVTVGQPLAQIVKDRKMYLTADVPARYYSKISDIKSAKFIPSYSTVVYDTDSISGHLLASGRKANAAYLPVTFEFEGGAGIIPDTFAEVYLIGKAREDVISLPVSAITEEQGVHYVYVQLDEDCYKKREVTLGGSDGERTEIVAGLQDGERVVTKGAIHVKLAGASNAIPPHTHNH